MALGVNSRSELPEMRSIVIQGEQCTAISATCPEMSKRLMELVKIGPCDVQITKDQYKNTVKGVLLDYNGVLGNMSDTAVTGLDSLVSKVC